jgi:hypothetical protein
VLISLSRNFKHQQKELKMKLLIGFALGLFLATSAMAASPEVLKTVLDSSAISSVKVIDKIEVVETYRCPNCYDIVVSGANDFGAAYVKVRTEQLIGQPIKVYLIEQSK